MAGVIVEGCWDPGSSNSTSAFNPTIVIKPDCPSWISGYLSREEREAGSN
jgi:hypothetical protein